MAGKCARQFMKFLLDDETKKVKKIEIISYQCLTGPANIAKASELYTSFSRVTIVPVRFESKNILTGAVAKQEFLAVNMVGGAQPSFGISPV
jgi:hypothetical protein